MGKNAKIMEGKEGVSNRSSSREGRGIKVGYDTWVSVKEIKIVSMKKVEKKEPWRIDNHLIVLGKSFPKNTNMTFR